MAVVVALDDSAKGMFLVTMIAGAVLGLVVIGVAVRLVRLARDVATAPVVDPMPWGSRSATHSGSDGSAATWALIESMRADHYPAQLTDESSPD